MQARRIRFFEAKNSSVLVCLLFVVHLEMEHVLLTSCSCVLEVVTLECSNIVTRLQRAPFRKDVPSSSQKCRPESNEPA